MAVKAPWDSDPTPTSTAAPTPTEPATTSAAEPSQADKDKQILGRGLQPARDRAAMRKASAPKTPKEAAPEPPPAKEKDSPPKPTHWFFKNLLGGK